MTQQKSMIGICQCFPQQIHELHVFKDPLIWNEDKSGYYFQVLFFVIKYRSHTKWEDLDGLNTLCTSTLPVL